MCWNPPAARRRSCSPPGRGCGPSARTADRLGGQLHGVEIHPASARQAARLLAEHGLRAAIEVVDFFARAPAPVFDAVIGNPPLCPLPEFFRRGAGAGAACGAGGRRAADRAFQFLGGVHHPCQLVPAAGGAARAGAAGRVADGELRRPGAPVPAATVCPGAADPVRDAGVPGGAGRSRAAAGRRAGGRAAFRAVSGRQSGLSARSERAGLDRAPAGGRQEMDPGADRRRFVLALSPHRRRARVRLACWTGARPGWAR